jgi:hypothetical protein
MCKTKDEIIRNARITTNIAYIMIDVVHSALFDMEQATKRANMEMRHDLKRYYKAAMHNLDMMLKEVNKIDVNVQEKFGDDGDMIYQFIKLLIDRCGEDNNEIFKFYNYVKTFPSKMNMDLAEGERIAFMNLDND